MSTDEEVLVTVTVGGAVVFVGSPLENELLSIVNAAGLFPARLHCDISALSAHLPVSGADR